MDGCLVTGADGFIGQVLCRRLGETGTRILRLVHRANSEPGTIAADLGRDPVPSLAAFRPEAVFHLAGRVHLADNGPGAAAEHNRVTVEGTRHLLEASAQAGVRSFVFFSTCGVMPVGSPNPVDETVEPRPTTPYARAKLSAEKLVIGANGANGMKTVCLRLPMVYGPGHKGQLARMVTAIKQGWFPPIPNVGGGRSLVHVEDVVDASLLVATNPRSAGKIYIVAEPHDYTSHDIYEIVLRALGRRPPNWHVPISVLNAVALLGDAAERLTGRRWPFDSDALRKLLQPARYSAARIERELGFVPKRSFAVSASELTDSCLS